MATIQQLTIAGTAHQPIELSITRDISSRSSTAHFKIITNAASPALYGEGLYGTAQYGLAGARELDEVLIQDSDGNRVFGGYIVDMDQQRMPGSNEVELQIKCRDYTLLLETTLVTTDYNGVSDRAIIQDAFGTNLPEIDTSSANIEIIEAVIDDFDVAGLSLSEMLSRLAEITKGEYFIDPDKNLHYFQPENNPATLGLSDRPHVDNLILQSEDFDIAPWMDTELTVDPDVATSPSGQQDASKFEETAATDNHRLSQAPPDSVVAAEPYTLSVYAKRAERRWLVLGIEEDGSRYAWFDLLTGNVGTIDAGITALMLPLPGGWFRCAVTRVTATDTIDNVIVGISNANGVHSYAGQVGNGLLIWAAQLSQLAGEPGWYGKTEAETIGVAAHYVMTEYTKQIASPANDVTVRGGIDSNGNEIVVNRTDAASINRYRRYKAVIVDRSILSTTVATLRADVELAQRAHPEIRAALTTEQDGFEVGQQVLVTNSARALDQEPLTIRRITRKQKNPQDTEYKLELGSPRGDIIRLLQQINRVAVPDPKFPQAIPPPNTIDDGMLKDGAVTRLKIAAQAVDTARLEVAAVTESILAAAAVTETKIGSGSISTPKLQAGAVTAAVLAAGSVVAGKVAADAIVGSNIQAGTITALDAVFAVGAIQNADIGNAQINQAKIASAAIGNAQIQNGAITEAKIGNAEITGAKIANATINSAKIQSVDADTITAGFLSVDRLQVNSINGNRVLDNSVTSSKVQSIEADKITAGTISASISITSPNITSTSGSNTVTLANGLVEVTNGSQTATMANAAFQVRNLFNNAFSSLAPGLLNETNPNGITTVQLYSYLGAGLQANSGNLRLNNSSGSTRVNIGVDNSNQGVLGLAGTFGVVLQAGNSSTVGMYVNGQKVVGGRGAAVSSPSGGGTVDVQARAAIDALRARLQAHGLIAT